MLAISLACLIQVCNLYTLFVTQLIADQNGSLTSRVYVVVQVKMYTFGHVVIPLLMSALPLMSLTLQKIRYLGSSEDKLPLLCLVPSIDLF